MKDIDGKFRIQTDGHATIVNPAGVPIPEDEPLFLFRARDRNALAALHAYYFACAADGCNEQHTDGIMAAIERFKEFRKIHPDRMKKPGITRGR